MESQLEQLKAEAEYQLREKQQELQAVIDELSEQVDQMADDRAHLIG